MKRIGLLIISYLFYSCATDKNNPVAMQLQGMWKLDRYESFDTTVKNWQITKKRTGYRGYLLYDGKGHMGVQLLPPDFYIVGIKNDPDSLISEELKNKVRLYSSSFSYFGTCKLKDNSSAIDHNILISFNPKDWNTTVTRQVSFSKDTLILTALETIDGLKTRLRWVKM